MAILEQFPVLDAVSSKITSPVISWFIRLDGVIRSLIAGSGFVFPNGNRAMISGAAGALEESVVTSTELETLDGVTANVQTQLNAKVPYTGASSAVDLNDKNLTNINDLDADTAVFGGATHYAEFEADGTLELHGDATGWRDENFSGAATAIGAGAPSLINWDTTSIQVPSFTHTTTKELNMLKEFDHAGKVGSTITFHAHLLPTTADAGTMIFYLQYYIKSGTSAAATNTISASVATNSNAWDSIRLDFAGVTSALLAQGTQIGARLYRLQTDPGTYTNPVAISTWGYHYETDTPAGSRTISSK